MRVTSRRIIVSAIARMSCLTALMVLACPSTLPATIPAGLFAHENISDQQREQLAGKLRKITGLRELFFDRTGFLRLGGGESFSGSRTARALVSRVVTGRDLMVLEDATNRSDVVFSRVVQGRWKLNPTTNPPAYIVLVDFADFDHVMGDRRALAAFDSGWALLHELDHIVNDSWDADSPGEPGECEAHINTMRRECNLPLRAEYFYSLLPQGKDSVFKRSFVRLAFAELDSVTKRKKRYWGDVGCKPCGRIERQQADCHPPVRDHSLDS